MPTFMFYESVGQTQANYPAGIKFQLLGCFHYRRAETTRQGVVLNGNYRKILPRAQQFSKKHFIDRFGEPSIDDACLNVVSFENFHGL